MLVWKKSIMQSLIYFSQGNSMKRWIKNCVHLLISVYIIII